MSKATTAAHQHRESGNIIDNTVAALSLLSHLENFPQSSEFIINLKADGDSTDHCLAGLAIAAAVHI